MFDEMFMEDCIEESPSAFLGCDLKVSERQSRIGGFRPDIVGLFRDETWIVEIQQRALDRVHLYKCLEYRDLLKQRDKIEKIKVVVVCNVIDEKYLPTAKTHGVEVIAIEREQFVDIASRYCPRSVVKFFKRRDVPELVARPRSMTHYAFRPLGWTGYDNIFDFLEHIHRECGRVGVELGRIKNSRYWSILHEVENLVFRDWKHSLSSIVDPENWNIGKLICEPKGWQLDFLPDTTRIRKPEIEIRAFVTIKGNLSVVWRPKAPPLNRHGTFDVGDWACWPGEGTYGWSRPSNELMFIRDINWLDPGRVSQRFESDICNWDVLDELFLGLIRSLYDWLCETLSSIVRVEKVSDFEFELADPSPDDFDRDLTSSIRAPKRIIGWSIYNLEYRKLEEDHRWIENFEKEYKISLKRLVDTYNSCLSRGRNRTPSNRAKYVSSEFEKEGILLSRTQINQIVSRLRERHSHYIEVASD